MRYSTVSDSGMYSTFNTDFCFPVLEYMNLDSGISESCLIVIPEELFSNTAVYCVPQDKLMHLFQLAFLKNNFY